MRAMLLKAARFLREMAGRCEIVFIPRDKEDKSQIDLADYKDGVDMDEIAAAGGGPQAVEKSMQEMRMQGVMLDELLDSGARGSRAHPAAPKKKKKKTKSKDTTTKDVSAAGGKGGPGDVPAAAGGADGEVGASAGGDQRAGAQGSAGAEGVPDVGSA